MSPSSLVCLLLVALVGGAVAQQCLQARVLGAGVVGLLSAVQLQKLGFNVTIHAYASPVQNSDYAYYASPHAGAWWSGNWNEYSYQSYSALMGMTVTEPKSTAILRKAHVCYVAGPPANPSELLHQNYADYFRNLTSSELTATWGSLFQYGYEMTAVMVSAPDYTKFLLDKFTAAGGVLIHENITSMAEFAARPNTDLVINAPGLGARFLGDVADAAVFPQRGQTLIMTHPNVTEIYRGRGSVDASDPGNWGTYILPRADGNIVVGGTRQENDWGTEVRTIDTTNIMNRATLLHPPIANATLVKYNVGFRPARTGGIRVELDATTFAKPVFHHYGHGGGGFEESWGSTFKLMSLVQARFPSIPTCPKAAAATCPTAAPTPAPCPATPTCPPAGVTSAAGRAEPFFKIW